ncbi:hypothetical protein RJ639_004144 [Escallonia herrerae]|uniref:Lipocalin/cytosolic fatty-acid binding domain-containing protein n=1 Tax=Escallonia herrerae TaxID=1293975 RepID=A0AA89B2B8_9ASTE|nr:hypothetical protein RJ639_004144 [Escallonia herrerae]
MTNKEMEVMKGLDIQRYMGRWYEIASFPSRFQPKNGANTRPRTSLKEDGATVNVLNETWSDGKRGFIEGSAYRGFCSSMMIISMGMLLILHNHRILVWGLILVKWITQLTNLEENPKKGRGLDRNPVEIKLCRPSFFNPHGNSSIINNSTLDQYGLYCLNADSHVDYEYGFSSSISSPEDSSEISSVAYCPTMFLYDFPDFQILGNDMQVISQFENNVKNMEGLEAISRTTIDDMCRWLDESESLEDFTPQKSIESGDVWSPGLSTKSSEASMDSLINSLQVLPGDDMENGSQLSLSHLLEGYAEAIEMEQGELAEVIVNCINEKVNPVGETLERIAFNLFQSNGNQGDYQRQESSKNYESALQWRFEQTRRRLYDHAKSVSLNLKVEEIRLGDLVRENEETKKMGKAMKTCSGYTTFFKGCLRHYEALYGSMEYNFPTYLAEARVTMESLFVAPHVSSTYWLQKWEDIRESSSFQAGDGKEGWRLSKESLKEAKEMVKEGETSYRVKMEGQNENEMVLEWRGTSLVRVSTGEGFYLGISNRNPYIGGIP